MHVEGEKPGDSNDLEKTRVVILGTPLDQDTSDLTAKDKDKLVPKIKEEYEAAEKIKLTEAARARAAAVPTHCHEITPDKMESALLGAEWKTVTVAPESDSTAGADDTPKTFSSIALEWKNDEVDLDANIMVPDIHDGAMEKLVNEGIMPAARVTSADHSAIDSLRESLERADISVYSEALLRVREIPADPPPEQGSDEPASMLRIALTLTPEEKDRLQYVLRTAKSVTPRAVKNGNGSFHHQQDETAPPIDRLYNALINDVFIPFNYRGDNEPSATEAFQAVARGEAIGPVNTAHTQTIDLNAVCTRYGIALTGEEVDALAPQLIQRFRDTLRDEGKRVMAELGIDREDGVSCVGEYCGNGVIKLTLPVERDRTDNYEILAEVQRERIHSKGKKVKDEINKKNGNGHGNQIS